MNQLSLSQRASRDYKPVIYWSSREHWIFLRSCLRIIQYINFLFFSLWKGRQTFAGNTVFHFNMHLVITGETIGNCLSEELLYTFGNCIFRNRGIHLHLVCTCIRRWINISIKRKEERRATRKRFLKTLARFTFIHESRTACVIKIARVIKKKERSNSSISSTSSSALRDRNNSKCNFRESGFGLRLINAHNFRGLEGPFTEQSRRCIWLGCVWDPPLLRSFSFNYRLEGKREGKEEIIY